MDVGMIAVAFGFGFAASMVRLPPLVGYLTAGFVLHAFDYETTEGIEYIADTGILLLLFGIGLKLKPSTLARPVIWGGATVHAGLTTLAVGGLLLGVGALGVPLAAELGVREAVLVGFAFSFCSTVFAVKALEGRNETSALQGRLAIGTLVVQDIFAVVFLTLAVDALCHPIESAADADASPRASSVGDGVVVTPSLGSKRDPAAQRRAYGVDNRG